MSYSYDRYERTQRGSSSRRGTFSYWIPLALTVTVATVGIAAWIWSERSDEEDELPPPPGGDNVYPRPDYGRNPDGSVRTGPPSYADVRPGEVAYGTAPGPRPEESQSYMARMSGALRRTPSPQQMFDGASRSVMGGIGAVGAVVGTALGSIMEENKDAYKDHNAWSEEAEARASGASPSAGGPPIEMRSDSIPGVSSARVPVNNGKRKTVAVVVSADTNLDDLDEDSGEFHEHASILSHLPRNTDFSKIRLFVLIYAPGLKEHPLDAVARPPGSLSSSFSNISHPQAQTPGEEAEKLLSSSSSSPAFNAVYSEALSLVEKETMVLPFTTPTGHVHILRHLNPDIVYLQESLAGDNGDAITHLQSWLRQDVVLVVGADGGHGGLADSESEAENVEKKSQQWWEREDRVGRGRGIAVVEGLRVGDDWRRRIENRE
ncbi:uncharacterized protein LY89DRAFT_637364 [Mollisia scopiformis]|uniref:Peroxin 22-like protein n=1 Tax=Mollisia scopiformis TaxID=149040 RepID=A0A194XN22_MOLSC|nr:uncharacterized protein LY89DRAFT_637364 [Mollisia scopiformis]KUJ21558.1 hypothetical protein LY89DRAFT_637364 [Mollisia scopiformis]